MKKYVRIPVVVIFYGGKFFKSSFGFYRIYWAFNFLIAYFFFFKKWRFYLTHNFENRRTSVLVNFSVRILALSSSIFNFFFHYFLISLQVFRTLHRGKFRAILLGFRCAMNLKLLIVALLGKVVKEVVQYL